MSTPQIIYQQPAVAVPGTGGPTAIPMAQTGVSGGMGNVAIPATATSTVQIPNQAYIGTTTKPMSRSMSAGEWIIFVIVIIFIIAIIIWMIWFFGFRQVGDPPGAACSVNSDCEQGTYCSASGCCTLGDGAREGDTCDMTADCMSGLRCDRDTHVCVRAYGPL